MYHSLFESLCMVPDPRIERKKIYPLDFLLLIVFLSTLSGNTSWYEIEDYAKEYEKELKSLFLYVAHPKCVRLSVRVTPPEYTFP